MDNLMQAQLQLESKYKSQAEDLLQASLEEALANGMASETTIGNRLIKAGWSTSHINITNWLNQKKGKASLSFKVLLDHLTEVYQGDVERLADLLVLCGLSACIDASLSDTPQPITNVATKVANEVLINSAVDDFLAKTDINEKAFDKGVAQRVQSSYKKCYTRARMRNNGYEPRRFDNHIKVAFGAYVIELVTRGAGFFNLENRTLYVGRGTSKELTCVVPNEWLLKTWEKNADLLARYSHKFIPCVVPPADWQNPWHGAYYGDLVPFTSLLRKDFNSSVFARNYKKLLSTIDLSYVYNVINGLQRTPWRINKYILATIDDILANHGSLGGLPSTDEIAQLPPLEGDYSKDELVEHRRKMSALHKAERSRQSRLLRLLSTLATVKEYAQFDKIYFPWNMDYRGRCYPLTPYLSPQGDDTAKALLEFAEPSPCKSVDDWKWLAIHGANCAGVDKVTFDERIQWILDNEDNIKASYEDPLGYTWWDDVAGGDYPLEFLAFCKEWIALREYQKNNNGSCIGFKCSIAIAFDGTCSGLQHFSAMLRDEVGGKAVNLTPSGKVEDIYGLVAEKVNKVLFEDAVSGTEDGYRHNKNGELVTDKNGEPQIVLGSKALASQWLMYARATGSTKGITRKVCKRSVMTLAYGSGRYGFSENLNDDIVAPFIAENIDDVIFTKPAQACTYLAGLIWDAVNKTVVKAVEGMKYLQALTRLVVSEGSSVMTWITPNGLPIQQGYMQVEGKQIQLRANGRRIRIYANEDTGNIDVHKQVNGISPNFIHSMDATHLQRVVTNCLSKGIQNLAMIHDSFGTDLANAGDLFSITRQEFVRLYDNVDHLERFTEQVKDLISPTIKLPKKPTFGTLKIQEVLKSDYCFA